MFNAIKVTAFASARPVSQQTKVFLTPRFALLTDGSLMPLNFTFVIVHYKEFNFACTCIFFVICRTFRSTQGFVYLVDGHARAAPWRVCSALKNCNISQCRVCMPWWSDRGYIISYKDSAVPGLQCVSSLQSLFRCIKKKGVVVRRGLHHFLTQYKQGHPTRI